MIRPIVRIVLRYGVGLVAGWEVGEMLAADPDVLDLAVIAASAVIGIVTEWWFARERRAA